MPRKPALDKFHKVLFEDMQELTHLNEREQLQLKRYRSIYGLCLDNPTMTDVKLRDFLTSTFGISQVQAYHDITNMRVLLGNVRNAGKEWVRYLVNETLKEAIDRAKNMKGEDGLKHVIQAANVMGKFNMLDKNEGEQIPWDEIVPVQIEPTTDPTVLNIKPLANKDAEIKRLYEKYKGEIEIEYTDYEELRPGAGKKEDIL